MSMNTVTIQTEIALALGVIVAVLLYFVLVPSRVRLIHSVETVPVGHSKLPLAAMVREQCPSLTKTFFPTPWLPLGHLQTIWAGIISKFPELRVDYDRELIDLPDGGLVAIDWAPRNHKELPASTPILVLLHGLAGGSRETYICDLVPRALDHGYKVAALNFRGCGGTEITTPQLYSGSWTSDVRLLAKLIKTRFPDAPLVGIGFSLGANILLKYVGEDGPDSPFLACVSVANPFDLNIGLAFLHSTWIGKEFYSRVMTKSLIEIFKRHKSMFSANLNHPNFMEPLNLSQIESAVYLPDFDSHATRKVFGFRSVTEYYRMGSSAQYLPDICIPTLLLSDLHDPIASRNSISVADVLCNPHIVLAITRRGGHIGWFEGILFPKRWFPRPVMEFVKAIVDSSAGVGKLPTSGKRADGNASVHHGMIPSRRTKLPQKARDSNLVEATGTTSIANAATADNLVTTSRRKAEKERLAAKPDTFQKFQNIVRVFWRFTVSRGGGTEADLMRRFIGLFLIIFAGLWTKKKLLM